MPRVVIVGAENSGKTQLFRVLALGLDCQDFWETTIGSSFKDIKNEPNENILMWDTSGASRYAQQVAISVKNNDAILYCVDLSSDISKKAQEKIEQDLKDYLKLAPKAKVILVGTKSDLDPTNAKKRLDALEIKDIELTKVLTSAKLKTGIQATQDTEKNEKSLFDILNALPKTLQDKKVNLTNLPPIASGFPSSYSKIWDKNHKNSQLPPEEQDYNSAKAILLDYCKGPIAPGLFSAAVSELKSLATGHWRHHISSVRKVLYNFEKTDDTRKKTSDLLKQLKQTLIEQEKHINPEGTLAKRIEFIQSKTLLKTDIIAEVNRAIDFKNKPQDYQI